MFILRGPTLEIPWKQTRSLLYCIHLSVETKGDWLVSQGHEEITAVHHRKT